MRLGDTGGAFPAPFDLTGPNFSDLLRSAAPDALAAGMADTAAVYFTNSTTLDVSRVAGAAVVARYPSQPDALLMSGYLSGAASIAGKTALAVAPLGRGDVVLFGFRPQHRAQSVGTFKLLFNALLGAGAPSARAAATR